MTLTRGQERLKRTFDVAVAASGLLISSPLLSIGVVAATVDTRQFGIFSQVRIGRYGKPFRIYKLRTMRTTEDTSTVTSSKDLRITRTGRLLRRTKMDELPQLFNVLRGDMSLVGPRPDVTGWADALEGPEREVLTMRPGITSPAALAFRNEEDLLAMAPDPIAYNRDILWPQKVRFNLAYVRNWSFIGDLRCMIETLLPERDR